MKAVALLGGARRTVAMGGGTDLLPQVRDGVVAAKRLVGLAAIPELAAIEETDDGGLNIGAEATIADVAAHTAGARALRRSGRGGREVWPHPRSAMRAPSAATWPSGPAVGTTAAF